MSTPVVENDIPLQACGATVNLDLSDTHDGDQSAAGDRRFTSPRMLPPIDTRHQYVSGSLTHTARSESSITGWDDTTVDMIRKILHVCQHRRIVYLATYEYYRRRKRWMDPVVFGVKILSDVGIFAAAKGSVIPEGSWVDIIFLVYLATTTFVLKYYQAYNLTGRIDAAKSTAGDYAQIIKELESEVIQQHPSERADFVALHAKLVAGMQNAYEKAQPIPVNVAAAYDTSSIEDEVISTLDTALSLLVHRTSARNNPSATRHSPLSASIRNFNRHRSISTTSAPSQPPV